MACAAVQLSPDFRDVVRIHLINDRVLLHRMPKAVLDRQDRHSGEVVLGQLYRAVEDSDEVLGLDSLRLRVRTVTLEAETVHGGGTQQVLIVSAMRRVAGCATLLERRLVKKFLLMLLGLIRMAGETGVYRVGLDESRRLSGMWVVASDAFAHRAGVLNFGRLNLIRLFVVA